MKDSTKRRVDDLERGGAGREVYRVFFCDDGVCECISTGEVIAEADFHPDIVIKWPWGGSDEGQEQNAC